MNFDYLKPSYPVNNTEYYNLMGETLTGEYKVWEEVDERCLIHENLIGLFENNSFLYRLVFDRGYYGLLKGTGECPQKVIGDLSVFDFDHSSSLKLKEDSGVIGGSSVTGIVCFPYLDWDGLLLWRSKAPKEFDTYLLNPLLVLYNGGAKGIFLTPSYYNGVYVELCNNLVIGLTGYPLFLTITNDEYVDRITCVDLDLTQKGLVEELHIQSANKGLSKLIDFWDENSCVSVPIFNDFLMRYEKVQPYNFWCESLDGVEVISTLPFTLKHRVTGEVIGEFYKFKLDAMFNVIDTEKGEFPLTSVQVKRLLDGEYDFYI